jgi:hypothetical protein
VIPGIDLAQISLIQTFVKESVGLSMEIKETVV